VLLKAKQKNTANCSIFGRLIAKNDGIYIILGISRKCGRDEIL